MANPQLVLTLNMNIKDKSNFISTLDVNSDLSFLEDPIAKQLFFTQEEETYCDILCNPNDYEEYEFIEAIYFFEQIKNKYRCKNKEYFEYYDKLQELFYKKLELQFPDCKYENVPDRWDKIT